MSCCEMEVDQSCEIEELDLENTINKQELDRIVSFYITNYFNDKDIYSDDLLLPKYIDLCIKTDICSGVDKAYKIIEQSGRFETSSNEHLISEDIRYVIKTLGQIKRFVPQEFAAGILLMHLEFIEGMRLY